MKHNSIDQQIVTRMIEGSDKDFEAFFKHFYRRLYLFVQYRVKDEALAKDAVSHAFYAIYTHRKTIDVAQNYVSYFYTVALNALRTLIRKQTDREFVRGLGDTLAHTYDVNDERDDREVRFEQVVQIIERMPVQDQQILHARYTDGNSIAHIARVMGKKEGTIKSRLSRSIAKIRKSCSVMQP